MMKDNKFQYVYEGKPDKQEVKTFDTYILDKLLKETKEFYSKFVHNNSNLSVIDFLDQANTYLDEERERVKNYYPIADFRDQVWKTLTKELIEKPGNDLISRPGDGLFNMLKDDNKKYSKLLYGFITEIKFDLSKFIAEIVEYIKFKIKEVNEKEVKDAGEQSSHLIAELIKFRSHLEDLVRDCFGNNAEIKTSISLQLQKLYATIDEFPKYLADYIDGFISKQGKQQGQGDFNEQVEEIFDVINLTAQRDAFLHFYEIALKNRLLGKDTFFEDIEKNFLSRLSQLFGETQIMKVKGMINDIVSSKEPLNKFKEYIKTRKNREILDNRDLEMSVLTKANWPQEVLAADVCKRPNDIDTIATEFENHYTNTMVGRKIEWLLGEGNVELIATFTKGKKTLICSVYQMCILTALDLCIQRKLKLGDLVESCKLNKKQMKYYMMPLIKSKLVKREAIEDIAPFDDKEFMSLNLEFTSKNRVLNIVPKKTLKGRDKKADQDQISSIRKKELDAALVRIMKSNRRMEFADLAKEVRKVIEHFPPSDRQ